MGATWLHEHKQIPKNSSLKLLVRFWNSLKEMFLEWPFSELFLKFWSVNKHGTCISEWKLLALYRHKEILVNSSLKATKKKKISKSNLKKYGRLAQLAERRTREHNVLGLYRCGFESPAGQLKLLIVFRMRPRSGVTVLYAEHVKRPGGILSSFVRYPCTIPRNN